MDIITVYTTFEPHRQAQQPIPTTGWALTTARRPSGGVHASLYRHGEEVADTMIDGDWTTGVDAAIALLTRIADVYQAVSEAALRLHRQYGDPADWWQTPPALDGAYTTERNAAAQQAADAGWDRSRFAVWFRSYVRAGAPYIARV